LECNGLGTFTIPPERIRGIRGSDCESELATNICPFLYIAFTTCTLHVIPGMSTTL
jgi:hypothetical protein